MSKTLRIGIITTIIVKKNNLWQTKKFEIKQIKEKILHVVECIVEPHFYNYYEYEDGCLLRLKKEYFDKNIIDLIEELDTLVPTKRFINYQINQTIIDKEEFYQQGFDLNLNEFKDNEWHDKRYYTSWNQEKRGYCNLVNIITEVSIYPSLICLWNSDIELEDESINRLLSIFNTMKSKYFKNPLSKSLIFYTNI